MISFYSYKVVLIATFSDEQIKAQSLDKLLKVTWVGNDKVKTHIDVHIMPKCTLLPPCSSVSTELTGI